MVLSLFVTGVAIAVVTSIIQEKVSSAIIAIPKSRLET